MALGLDLSDQKSGGLGLDLSDQKKPGLGLDLSDDSGIQAKLRPFASKVASILGYVPRPPVMPSELKGEEIDLRPMVSKPFKAPFYDPFLGKTMQGLETASRKVKDAVQASIGEIVGEAPPTKVPLTDIPIPEKARNLIQLGKAGVGSAASIATTLAPFSPSELAAQLSGSVGAAAKELAPALKQPIKYDKNALMQEAVKINKFVSEVKQPQLNALMDDVVKEVGADYMGHAKSPGSIVDKVSRKLDSGINYDPYSAKDHARGAIILKDWSSVKTVIDRLKDKGFNMEVTVDAPLNKFGYRGVNSSVQLGDKINGEIQVHTHQSWKLKEVTDGIYRKWRNFTDESLSSLPIGEKLKYYRDIFQSRKLWKDYWDTIPLEMRPSTSASVKGLDSVIAPSVSPASGTIQAPSSKTLQLPSAVVQNSLPSESLESSAVNLSRTSGETSGLSMAGSPPSAPIVPGETSFVKPGPELREPILKREITKGMGESFKEFFSKKPEGLKNISEAQRVNRVMAAAIRSDQVPVESIPIFRDYGLTNADKELAASYLEEAATASGQTLNILSQVRKSMSPEVFKDLPDIGPTTSDSFAMRADKALGRVADVWRASLVSQLKTSIRNFAVGGARFSLKALDDAMVGTMEMMTGKKPPRQALAPAIEDIYAVFRNLTPSGRSRITGILDAEPLTKKVLYGSPVSDLTIGWKYAKLLNVFNRTQEFFTRNIVFDATLTGDLERLGLKSLDQAPEATRIALLKRATDSALDITMAAAPRSQIAKGILKAWNEIPIVSKILQVGVYPFPRFMMNSLKAIYEYSPFGMTRFIDPKVRAALTSKDPRVAYSVISKAAVGTAMFSTAAYFRNSKYAGEKWYEIKPDPDNRPNYVVDLRPFNPVIPTYMFLVEGMKNSGQFSLRDWIEGTLGVNRIAGTTLYMTSMLSDMGPDSFKKALKEFTGEFLGGFSVPFRTFKDFYAHFSKEERLPRETKGEALTGPFKANLPKISQALPVQEALTRPEPKEKESPALEQITGVRGYTKTELEAEIDRLGIQGKELYPNTGIKEADNDVRRLVGSIIEKQVLPVIRSEYYQGLPDPVKKEILKNEIAQLRADATKFAFQSSAELTRKRAQKQLPKQLQKLVEEKRYGELGALPKATQKKLERLLIGGDEE